MLPLSTLLNFSSIITAIDMLPLSTLSKIQLGVPASHYATQSCLTPKRIKVRLAETGDWTDIYCDCGKCLRCLDARRNELASRMFLHSIDYEFVYYVTLTYGSYNLLPFKRHPFLASWLQTVPSYDDYNSTGRKCWTPSILVRSHLTNYIKRLRVAVGAHLSYAACGELGEDFGRPHFHIIIWSHTEITPQQFYDAWSYECKRTADKTVVRPWRDDLPKTKENGYFRFHIGRVDVHDLWANGSLNYDGRHPGRFGSKNDPSKDAMHNFTYVAKYIGKSDPFTWSCNMAIPVLDRIQRAYNFYTRNIDDLAKKSAQPELHELVMYNSLTHSIDYDNCHFDEVDFFTFKKLISPFFVSSRRPSLAKNYYLKNRQRFLSKGYGLPTFMGKPIEFPKYFHRLIAQEKYPIRLRKNCASGISLTKDLLPRVYAYYSALREDNRYWFDVRGYAANSKTQRSPERARYESYTLDGLVLHNSLDCIDFVDPKDKVIHFTYDPYQDIFRGFQYDESLQSYTLYDFYEREDFCDMVLDYIEDQYKEYRDKLQNMQIRFDLTAAILEDPDSWEAKEQFVKIRKNLQNRYKITKPKLF